jgi:hypothetical protein
MLHQPQTHHMVISLHWKSLKHTFNFLQAHTIEIVKTLESSHAQTHFNSKNSPKLFLRDSKKLALLELSRKTSKGFLHLNSFTQIVHPQSIFHT